MEEHARDDPNAARWHQLAAAKLLEVDRPVVAMELLHETDALSAAPSEVLRKLLSELRSQGYLKRALLVAAVLEDRGSAASRSGDQLRSELAVLDGSMRLAVAPPLATYIPQPGRVLNVVGSSLSEIDSSYTRRTHAVARHVRRFGVEASVVTQMGVGDRAGYDIDEWHSVNYHRIPGPSRGNVPFGEWLQVFANRLASVVRKVRPAALVASSDFVNGLAARAVCESYGIPFVYDVRGTWEDSWLARQRDSFAWTSEEVPQQWGFPENWALRRDREAELARSADAVVVLSAELRDELVARGANLAAIEIVESPEADAAKWLAVLERVGALEPGSAELAGQVFSAAEAALLRAQQREPLGMVAVMGGKGSAREIRDRGWRLGNLAPVRLELPFDWVNACKDHRSQGFLLHAWDFMVPLLVAWENEGDRTALDWCLERAVDWSRTFADGDARGTMAYYDMALGMRAPRLAYLLQEAVHEGADPATVEILGAAALRTALAIHAPSAFNGKTNHGFYTAVGQLAFAKRLQSLPGMELVTSQGEERLRTVVATQFAEDGGHLEHSPDYHRMLLFSFLDAMEDGLLSDPDVRERIERATEVLGWFVQPDRRLVQIGDSPSRDMRRSTATTSPHTNFLVSDGRMGEPNPDELLVLPESGYAFVRSPQPAAPAELHRAGYLSFMGSFHSRTHKHCDDLSITWFDDGRELLIDAGRFGYLDQLPPDSPQREEGFFYGRPERQYVERARAHNTVQADGREPDRRRPPYGSALTSGNQHGDIFWLTGRVDHGAWSHHRTLVFKPGSWLLVDDELASVDDAPHDFSVWWNVPAELGEAAVDGSSVVFAPGGSRSLRITPLTAVDLLAPVKGQAEPLRGWRSKADDEFTPSWSLAHELKGRMKGSFSTLLSLGDGPDIEAVRAACASLADAGSAGERSGLS